MCKNNVKRVYVLTDTNKDIIGLTVNEDDAIKAMTTFESDISLHIFDLKYDTKNIDIIEMHNQIRRLKHEIIRLKAIMNERYGVIE
jgi:phosphoserine aminotransferase